MFSNRVIGSQLTLHKLNVFCVVADLGSISRAADKLGIAQPAVTSHMKSIQEKLGVDLLTKQGRNIVLTDNGKLAYKWARDLIVRTREFERELSEGPTALRGRVVVGASLTVGGYTLPHVFASFRRENPGISVQVQVDTAVDCVAALKAGVSDVAVTGLDPGQNVDGLEVSKLWDEELVLVAAQGSTLVGDTAGIDEIANLPFVTNELGSSKNGVIESVLRPFGIVHRSVALEIGHPEGIKSAVLADCGLAFLFASSIQKELQGGSLRRVRTPNLDLSIPMYLLKRREKNLSPVQDKVRSFLEAKLKHNDLNAATAAGARL